MPNRKAPPSKKGKQHLRPKAIIAKREEQLALLEALRARRGKLEGCAKNAHLMLTRGWGRANWAVRAELLRASTWLISIERLREFWPGA